MRELIIDVGHDERKGGADCNGYSEYNLNLIVARRVYTLLKAQGVDVSINQTKKRVMTDSERVSGIKNKYQYCLSIHFNAGGGRGLETIHSIKSSQGKVLADCLAKEAQRATSIPIRRVFSREGKYGNDYYYIHRLTGATVTVICEALFLDNMKDLNQLNLEKIAQGWANGYLRFKGIQDAKKEPVNNTPNYTGIQDSSKGVHKKIGLTHVIELDPMDLRISIIDGVPTDQFPNMATSGYQWYHPSNPDPALGVLVSEGIVYNNRQPHYKAAGTLIVYTNGKVVVKPVIDINREQMVYFAVSGCSVYPKTRMVEEGFVGKFSDIGRPTYRMVMGYRSKDNKVIIAYRPMSSIARAYLTLKNLGCDSGITLDSGGSSLLINNGKSYKDTTRKLYSVITW